MHLFFVNWPVFSSYQSLVCEAFIFLVHLLDCGNKQIYILNTFGLHNFQLLDANGLHFLAGGAIWVYIVYKCFIVYLLGISCVYIPYSMCLTHFFGQKHRTKTLGQLNWSSRILPLELGFEFTWCGFKCASQKSKTPNMAISFWVSSR